MGKDFVNREAMATTNLAQRNVVSQHVASASDEFAVSLISSLACMATRA